jgi:hypothetical protein
MPAYQRMFGRVNRHFHIDSIGSTREAIHEALMDPGTTLLSIAETLGVVRNDDERAVLEALPRGIQSALRALLADNFARQNPWEVQFVWAPAYDYTLTVHEVGPSSISEGGISVILGTRSPDDPLPHGAPG